MKKNKKIFLITTVILVILLILIPIKGYCIENLITGMQGSSGLTPGNKVTEGLNSILSLVRYVGSGVSVIVVLLLGIKYMIASIEDKAEIKKRAVPIVIGCIILFATTNLLVIINDVVSDFAS